MSAPERHKVAFETLDVIDKLASVMKAAARKEWQGDAEGAADVLGDAWSALNDSELPRDVAKRARATLGAILSGYKEARLASARDASRSFFGKILITAPLVGLAFLLAHKDAPLYSCLVALGSLCVWNVKEPFFWLINEWKKRV